VKLPPSPQPTSKQVGIWIRVSTEDQAQGDSPAHHEQRAREYAKFNGWHVREVYDLAGVSGKTVMEHPEAKRMLADIKRGHISALIFSKLARLARNTKELLDFSDKFRASNADMVSLQEKIDTSTPAGRLFYTMIAAMAQWEREEIGDRIRASVGIRAKLGKQLSGSTPYGYRWVDKKLTLEPSEAPLLKRAFELFIQHRRKGTVARLLNAAGHRTRTGAQWSDTGIARLLTQSAAKGIYFTNTMRKTGDWKFELKPEDQWGRIEVTPVITEEIWHQTGNILEQQTKKPARLGPVPVKIFAGLTVCQCGCKMYVPTRSKKYTCEKCKNKIPADDLEAIFCQELQAYFVAPERITERLAQARQGLTEKESGLAAHRQEIQKVREEMTRTHRLYLDGQIPLESFGGYHKPLEERLLQLQNELPRLEAEVTHLQIRDLSADEVLKEARQLHAVWPSLPVERKQSIVQSLVERIVVGRDEIELTLSCLPSSEEVTKSQQQLSLTSLNEDDRIARIVDIQQNGSCEMVRSEGLNVMSTAAVMSHHAKLTFGALRSVGSSILKSSAGRKPNMPAKTTLGKTSRAVL
jgi:site-specific DNA recombinase